MEPSTCANKYDTVAGGSLRIYRRDVQARVFDAIGLSEVEARAKFGYLLDAFDIGAPPHGGIAFGLDRLVMLLAGTPSQGSAQHGDNHVLCRRCSWRRTV